MSGLGSTLKNLLLINCFFLFFFHFSIFCHFVSFVGSFSSFLFLKSLFFNFHFFLFKLTFLSLINFVFCFVFTIFHFFQFLIFFSNWPHHTFSTQAKLLFPHDIFLIELEFSYISFFFQVFQFHFFSKKNFYFIFILLSFQTLIKLIFNSIKCPFSGTIANQH